MINKSKFMQTITINLGAYNNNTVMKTKENER